MAPDTAQLTAPQAEKEPIITEESVSEDEAIPSSQEHVMETENNNGAGFDSKALLMQILIGLVIAIIIAAFFLT